MLSKHKHKKLASKLLNLYNRLTAYVSVMVFVFIGFSYWLVRLDTRFQSALAASSPVARLQEINCAYGLGWGYDPDNASRPIGILVYAGGPFGVGQLVVSTSADKNPARFGITDNVAAITGVSNTNAFFFHLPASVRNNQPQDLYFYALDASGDPNIELTSFRTTLTCSSGNASVTNTVDNLPLTITATDRLAGAVDSLTWKGKEFVNTYDHGRQIQYAWTENGWGECKNPTEAGSHYDDVGATSTTILKSISATGGTLTTVTNPAYWALPGTSQTFCQKVQTAQNTELVTRQTMNKTMQIGYAGLDNVIKTEINLDHNSQDLTELKMQMPTGYLTPDFNKFYRFNPKTNQLNSVVKESKYAGSIFTYNRNEALPVILATSDGQHAMGVYTNINSNTSNLNYALLEYPNSDPNQATNIWSINYQNGHFPVGQHTFTSYMIVGDLATVQQSMQQLYQLHPTDVQMPQGSLDTASCDSIVGWTWDPKAPNKSIYLELFTLDSNKREISLGTHKADIHFPHIADIVSQDNGLHGFSIPTPIGLKDGQQHTIYARAINTDHSQVNPLIPGVVTVNCSKTITNLPPIVNLVNPLPEAKLTTTQAINLKAMATDLDGSIAKVEFYLGNQKIGEDTNAVDGWNLNQTFASGNHILTVKATDSSGQTTVSSQIPIQVLGITGLNVSIHKDNLNSLMLNTTDNKGGTNEAIAMKATWSSVVGPNPISCKFQVIDSNSNPIGAFTTPVNGTLTTNQCVASTTLNVPAGTNYRLQVLLEF